MPNPIYITRKLQTFSIDKDASSVFLSFPQSSLFAMSKFNNLYLRGQPYYKCYFSYDFLKEILTKQQLLANNKTRQCSLIIKQRNRNITCGQIFVKDKKRNLYIYKLVLGKYVTFLPQHVLNNNLAPTKFEFWYNAQTNNSIVDSKPGLFIFNHI